MSNKTLFYKSALSGLYFSGAYHLLKNRFNGIGALLTLHHVEPAGQPREFSPNRILGITPEFLESTILQIRDMGYDIVSLDEFRRRLDNGGAGRRCVSFTLDDGYADNFHHAYPVFEKHEVPFTIYVCTGLMDQSIDLWWQELEDIVLAADQLDVFLNRRQHLFDTRTTKQKYEAFERIYWSLRRMPLDLQLETFAEIRGKYAQYVASPAESDTPLSWDMLAQMERSGLLTVGAHTVRHYALSKLSVDEAKTEIATSRDVIEQHTGSKPMHFAYPYGDALSAAAREFGIVKKLGFSTGVTTRKGVIFREHADHAFALPRVSLNGDFQQQRNVKLFLSGLPFALFNGFRKLDVA